MEKFRAIHSRIDTKNSDHSTTYCWQKVLLLIVHAMVDRQDLILLDSASINLWELDVEFLLLFDQCTASILFHFKSRIEQL